jgi:hypothetical protein
LSLIIFFEELPLQQAILWDGRSLGGLFHNQCYRLQLGGLENDQALDVLTTCPVFGSIALGWKIFQTTCLCLSYISGSADVERLHRAWDRNKFPRLSRHPRLVKTMRVHKD